MVIVDLPGLWTVAGGSSARKGSLKRPLDAAVFVLPGQLAGKRIKRLLVNRDGRDMSRPPADRENVVRSALGYTPLEGLTTEGSVQRSSCSRDLPPEKWAWFILVARIFVYQYLYWTAGST